MTGARLRGQVDPGDFLRRYVHQRRASVVECVRVGLLRLIPTKAAVFVVLPRIQPGTINALAAAGEESGVVPVNLATLLGVVDFHLQ